MHAAELEQALRIDPAFPEAHNNLARVLAAEGFLAEALDHARRAVSLNPDYAEAHYNLAMLLGAAGDRRGAIAEFRSALAIRPQFPVARRVLKWHSAERPDSAARFWDRLFTGGGDGLDARAIGDMDAGGLFLSSGAE